MKTIKIIDLLNKIANGEVPKKVLFHGFLYRVEGNNYYSKDTDEYLINDLRILNETVEIVEDTPKEDEKIERLDETKANEDIFTYSTSGSNLYFLSLYVKSTIVDKINEIIDKVNGE